MQVDLNFAIRRTLLGEVEAFEEIVKTCEGAVYNLAFRLLGNPEDARDVAQETFLRAFRNLGFYDSKRPFVRWILSITYNLSIDLLRQRNRERKALKEASILARCQSQNSDPEGAEVQELLDKLEGVDRAIVVLKYWYGFTCSEVGEIVGLGEEAVKARLYRARLRLADELRKGGWQL